jgi:hypothetical protein
MRIRLMIVIVNDKSVKKTTRLLLFAVWKYKIRGKSFKN